ncbi:MAG: response regulator [Parvibaculaceae bacterium]
MSAAARLPAPHRILLVDDHPVVLAGMKALVNAETDLEVVGAACDARTALLLLASSAPQVIIVDVSLPETNGVSLIRQLRDTAPLLLTLALTVHEEAAYAHQALQAGARGYVLKRSAAEELVRAIRAVLGGGIYIDPTMAARMLSKPGQSLSPKVTLSDRETEVLKLVAQGFSNKEIAARISISVKSVETYRARATEKLGLRTRAALVRYGTLEGWLAT